MFNEPTRRVNLAGRNSASLHSNRSTLLEQSRREREQRQQQKQQQSAAVRIQAFVRAQQHIRRRKDEQRQLFDELLPRTIAQYKQPPPASPASTAASSPLSDLVVCIRQFLFFYSRRTASDRQRWAQVQQLLTLSLREPQSTPLQHSNLSSSRHYSSLLLLSPSHNATWRHQVSRIASLLLADIGSADSSETAVAGAALLLFQLFSAQQWSVYPNGKAAPLFAALLAASPSSSLSTLQQTINAAQLHVLNQLVYIQPSSVFHSLPRFRFGFPSAAVSWHAALRTRLLQLTEVGSAASVSTAAKNAVGLLVLLSVVPLQLQLSATSTVSSSFASSFVAHFLSIPLLSARLQALGLSAILQRAIEPAVVSAALQQRTNLSNCLSLVPASRSYSAWDTEVKASPPAVAMEVDDDDDNENGAKDEYNDAISASSSSSSSSSSCPTSPPSLWLLGNLLDWHSLLFTDKDDSAVQQRLSVYLSVLEELVVDLPASAFPSKRTVVHPTLLTQLSILYSRHFLDRIISRLHTAQRDVQQSNSQLTSASSSLSPPSSSLRDVVTICVLIDTLLFKWGESRDILNALSFSTNLIRFLWDTLTSTGTVTAVLTSSSSSTSLVTPTVKPTVDLWSSTSLVSSVVPLFCSCYAHLLPVLSDAEFFGDDTGSAASADIAEARSLLPVKADAGTPIPVVQQSELVRFLVALSYRLYWVDEGQSTSSVSLLTFHQQQKVRQRMKNRLSAVLVLLRDRQSRRSFTGEATWIMHQLPFAVLEAELKAASSHSTTPALPLASASSSSSSLSSASASASTSRAVRLFSALPFVFPFTDRLRLFYSYIDADKSSLSDYISFLPGRGVKATIHRTHLLEDGFTALHPLGEKLKGRVAIEFVDETGAREAGVDGGGLFREFVSELIKHAFNPSWGLFCVNDQHDVYPNPDSLLPLGAKMEDSDEDDVEGEADYRERILSYYHFIGQMVGKLLYEKLQAESRFASFFLRKILGHVNTLDDLSSLDHQLYRSLMKLRNFTPQQLDDMHLAFSVDRPIALHSSELEAVPLIADGLNTAVTSSSLTRYLHLLSDYKLNKSLHRQCRAFQHGLQSIIPRDWLSVFTAEELRLLISGEDRIDVDELRQHTVYGSGYSDNHELVRWFWSIVDDMSAADRSALLRFVTSVPRRPLQGFGALQPKFCVQRVEYSGGGVLPTSATCMNLLRLPRYKSRDELQERLLYAIRNGVGFGLT